MDENDTINEEKNITKEELVKLTEFNELTSQINNVVENKQTDSESSSRGESEAQPFKKSIAEMEEEQRQPTITIKELKALKRARYSDIANKFRYAYVLRNKKTGLVVELRAASSLHACNMIGWRKNNARLIEVIDKQKETNAEIKKEETNK